MKVLKSFRSFSCYQKQFYLCTGLNSNYLLYTFNPHTVTYTIFHVTFPPTLLVQRSWVMFNQSFFSYLGPNSSYFDRWPYRYLMIRTSWLMLEIVKWWSDFLMTQVDLIKNVFAKYILVSLKLEKKNKRAFIVLCSRLHILLPWKVSNYTSKDSLNYELQKMRVTKKLQRSF